MVPLVVALLVAGVTSRADAGAVGPVGALALGVFVSLLAAGSVLVALVTPWLLTLLHVMRTTAATAGVSSATAAAPLATH